MPSKTHVFAVAVENYQDTTIPPVVYAENDAGQFVEAWKKLGVDPADCNLLLSSKATHAAILSHLKKFLNSVAKNDRVVFFYAGHGAAFSDISYVTAHDTQRGDIQATSIPLNEILRQLRASRSEQVLLFFDSCHSGLPISAGMRSIYSAFSADELNAFCADSKYAVGFASCRIDEFSYPSRKLAHGIWSHCVIRALRGDVKEALDKGCLVTGSSLQGYVIEMVPRILRLTFAGKETQTPCSFGNFTKEFVIADVSAILAAKAAKAGTLGNLLKDTFLRGVDGGQIRSLSGFKKGYHREPSDHFSAAESFVKRVGQDDVKSQAEEITAALKRGFKYKFKDVDFACDDGAATIKTPDFDVNVWIEQDKENASAYVLTTDVSAIRRQAVVMEDEFSNVFSRYCDTVVIALSTALDVGEKIGQIENIKELADHLDYTAEGDALTLDLPGEGIRLGVTENQITIRRLGGGNLKTLLTSAQTGLTKLGGSGVVLMLPEKTSP